MALDPEISRHYTRGDLLQRLHAALRDDGVDPDHPTPEALAPYDQFHGRGLEATEELAARLTVSPSDHLLDVGSGIGGPTPWAQRADSSFLATPAETIAGLTASGFTGLTWRDMTKESLAFGARSRARAERGRSRRTSRSG